MRIPRLLSNLLICSISALPISAQSPTPIFTGVTQVWANGAVGPVTGIPGHQVTPLISGDQDTRPPGLFAAMSTSGLGQALAIGHESILGDTANGAYHTSRFNLQAIQWLDRAKTRTVGLLSGHGEWLKKSKMGVLSGILGTAGFKVLDIPGTVTGTALNGVGVVIVGNAWKAFSASEISVLQNHVKAGGGLYLTGVGWSWQAYRGNLDLYPMNVLGEKFGLRWQGGTFSDPTNNHLGKPLFHTFYPNCNLYLPTTALSHLELLLAQHNSDLNTYIRNNQAGRTDFLIATGQVTAALGHIPTAGGARAIFDKSVGTFLRANQKWFGMAGTIDKTKDPALAIARDVLHSGVNAAFPLTPTRLAALVPILGIAQAAPEYSYLHTNHQLLLLDNRTLVTNQRLAIKSLLDNLTGVPRNMIRMTVKSSWGTTLPDLGSSVAGKGVNIFGTGLTRMENGFPQDVSAWPRPVFSIVVAHEVTHAIDAAMKDSSATYRASRAKLLVDAGLDDNQYLRSMVGAAYFQKAPQELVASFANQWLIDSVHTLRLGLGRWRIGKGEPILQALFMLDLFGQYGIQAPMYRCDPQGQFTTKTARLTRDSVGRVQALESPDATLRFTYEGAGKVKDLAAVLAYGESSSQLGVTLQAPTAPWLGNSGFKLTGKAPAPNSPGLLLLGTSPTDLTLPGIPLLGRLYVSLTNHNAIAFGADSTGAIQVPMPIPSIPELKGQRLYIQAMAYRKNPGGPDLIGVSKGLELTLGN